MNIGFGLGVVLLPLLILCLSVWLAFKVKRKILIIPGILVSLIVFSSVQTYAPRNKLHSNIPKAPIAGTIERGSELIPDQDRWGKLEDAIKRNEERQAQ